MANKTPFCPCSVTPFVSPYFYVILATTTIVRLSTPPVVVVPDAAVAPVPGLLSSATVLEPAEPDPLPNTSSKVGHEGVGDVVVDTGEVAGVARGCAGLTGAQGISPGLEGLEVTVVQSCVL